jgi:hypothetical protein
MSAAALMLVAALAEAGAEHLLAFWKIEREVRVDVHIPADLTQECGGEQPGNRTADNDRAPFHKPPEGYELVPISITVEESAPPLQRNARSDHFAPATHEGKCSACQSASRAGLILPSITNTPGAPSATQAFSGSRSESVRTVAARVP